MTTYSINGTRCQDGVYIVEASNPEEARRKVESGDYDEFVEASYYSTEVRGRPRARPE